MNICTIVAKNYVAHARTLAESFTKHHPGSRCFTLIIDDFDDDQISPADEPFVVVRPSDLSLAEDDFDDMRARYSVLEFSTAVKPWLLEYMLAEHDDNGIAYFDPDIRVYSRMVELEEALQHASIVLTPHLAKPMPRDGLRPSETDIMVAGIYNLGFIGLSAGAETDELLRWWGERLRTDCWVAPDRGLFVDQKWVDWVPGLFKNVEILRVPTYNIAYWNVPTRTLERADDGSYTVDGLPLRFFHFSGYDPHRPLTFSKHQNRVPLIEGKPLHELCHGYGERLLANQFDRVKSFPYDHDFYPSGQRIDTFSRQLYRDAFDAGAIKASIFTPEGEAAFADWLTETDEHGMTRYVQQLWQQRTDLQQAYPRVPGSDLHGYLGWCRVFGKEQLAISDELLGTPVQAPAADETAVDSPMPSRPVPSAEVATVARPFGVNVAGYLQAELGVGEVARQLIKALDTAGISCLPHALTAPGSRQGHSYAARYRAAPTPFPVNLILVNADMLPSFAAEHGDLLEDRYTIGYWWWELEDFPADFSAAFDLVDEVWVGSQFVATALKAHTDLPVITVPAPVELVEPAPLHPGELGWPQDRFTYLFSWDYNSVARRKNPLAVVEAFRAAFEPADGAALVLKCINAERHAAEHAELVEAIEGRDDIVLIDEYVAARDKDRLMATCDCYVSLHRSEGLGLTLAEAMFMGKPVIATNYSGNTDFMTPANSYLVDYTLELVGRGAEPYPPTAHWARPDTAHAARLMREVFEHQDAAREKGRRGAADIRTMYSANAISATLRRRLEQVQAEVPGERAAVGTPIASSAEVGRLVRRGTLPRAPSRFGKPGAAARRALLRTLKPYSAYQNDVNDGLLEALEHSQEVLREGTAHAAKLEVAQATDLTMILSTLRQQRQSIEQLVEAVSATEQRSTTRHQELHQLLDVQTARADRLAAELSAVPYMADDALATYETPEAGRVFGYSDAPAGTPSGDQYRAFEELFRGSEAFIGARQERYLPLLAADGPVLDFGCGRGEFLDVLSAAGIDAIGVDSDAGMVARCLDKGHSATTLADGLEYLEGLEDGSLGTIFSAQVVEHLPPDVLRRFIELAPRKLRPGGRFIAETVNPHSVAALKTFWVDVTHQHPLFPEVMVAFCRLAGFSSAYAFHPNGTGDVDVDRSTTGEYAVVATV